MYNVEFMCLANGFLCDRAYILVSKHKYHCDHILSVEADCNIVGQACSTQWIVRDINGPTSCNWLAREIVPRQILVSRSRTGSFLDMPKSDLI